MLLARGNARLMFFDELKLPFFRVSDSSDSAADNQRENATSLRHSFSAFSLLCLASPFRLCFVSLGYFSFLAPKMIGFVRFSNLRFS
jgi:hypothetical protein